MSEPVNVRLVQVITLDEIVIGRLLLPSQWSLTLVQPPSVTLRRSVALFCSIVDYVRLHGITHLQGGPET